MSINAQTDSASALAAHPGTLAHLGRGDTSRSDESAARLRGHRPRLRYWLGSEFQFRYVLLTVFFGIATSTILGTFLFTIFWQVAMEELTWRTGSLMPVEVYAKVRFTFLVSTVVVGSVITFAAAAVSVWITHRVAGPLYGMNRTLTAWLNGDRRTRIKLRKHDELQDFAGSLNRLVDNFDLERAATDAVIRETIGALQGRAAPRADQLARRLESALSTHHLGGDV